MVNYQDILIKNKSHHNKVMKNFVIYSWYILQFQTPLSIHILMYTL